MERAAAFLRSVSQSGAGGVSREGLESAEPSAIPDRREFVERFREEVSYIAKLTGEAPDQDAVDELAMLGEDGLRRLDAEGERAQLSEAHLGGLEAVIETDGSRPVLFVKDGRPDLDAPSLRGSPFTEALQQRLDGIAQVCRSVARVDDPKASIGYQGTCFVVGDDLVMTNRHVLQAITAGGADTGKIRDDIFLDFGREVGRPSRPEDRFRLKAEPVFRGSTGKGEFGFGAGLNFDGLDLAILQVQLNGRRLPPPLPLRISDTVMMSTQGRLVHLVGYPGNSKPLTPAIFERVFASVKSFKRLAPGAILEQAGDGLIERDPRDWVMTHDASTLGGNSGSAVADLDTDGSTLLGLHFGGAMERRNWAHAFERLGTTLNGIGVAVKR